MYSVAHQMMEVEPMFCEKLWAPRYKKNNVSEIWTSAVPIFKMAA